MPAYSPFRLHCHFGAGSLSVGLVFDAINPTVPLIVFQRRGGKYEALWKALSGQVDTLVQNSAGYTAVFGVHVQQPDDDAAIRSFIQSRKRVLLLYEDLAPYGQLLREASVISTSIGRGNVGRVLQDLSDLKPAKEFIVVPFENAPNLFQTSLPSVRIVPTVPDRICSEPDENPVRPGIYVRCEPHKRIMFGPRTQVPDAVSLSFPGTEVVYADSIEHWEFELQRKRLLVNTFHTILSVLGYAALADVGAAPRLWANQQFPFLVHALTETGTNSCVHVQNISHALVCFLLIWTKQHWPSRLKERKSQVVNSTSGEEAFFEEHLDFLQGVTKRMRESTDLPARIIDLKKPETVYEKQKDQVRPLLEFLVIHGKEVRSLCLRRCALLEDMTLSVIELSDRLHRVNAKNAAEQGPGRTGPHGPA